MRTEAASCHAADVTPRLDNITGRDDRSVAPRHARQRPAGRLSSMSLSAF